MDEIITKEEFLAEHNKLSPKNLQATLALLTRFQEEKKPLLKDSRWSFKMRIPFILWLTESAKKAEKTDEKISLGQGYRNYPETH